jgi:hypothetical protein
LIDKFSLREFTKTPDLQHVIKIFEEPSKIFIDEGGIYYFDETGDKIYCPKIKTSISEKGEWISFQLPDIGFDIDQNGSVRKADEAEALYCCLQVSHILKEKEFRDEVVNLSKNYDFSQMREITNSDSGFRDLLNSWQELQSVSINIIVSACKYKISSEKKDTEKFLKDGIQELEAAELRNLEAKIRSINFSYSQGVLSPQSVKNLTKIERLEQIDKRDDEISACIKESPVGLLYKALKLSSEYISPVKKKKISLWVQSEVDKLISSKEFEDKKEDRRQLISQFVKRAYRFEKISVRRKAVESYIKDGENFKLPSKL